MLDKAFDRIAYTDDGSTLYVHILPKVEWWPDRRGRAYALAFADHWQLTTLASYRALLREAWLLLHDEVDDIVRWFDEP